MVGEQDMAGDFLSKTGIFPEFCFGDTVHDRGATAFIGEHLSSIEPVLAMIASHEDF